MNRYPNQSVDTVLGVVGESLENRFHSAFVRFPSVLEVWEKVRSATLPDVDLSLTADCCEFNFQLNDIVDTLLSFCFVETDQLQQFHADTIVSLANLNRSLSESKTLDKTHNGIPGIGLGVTAIVHWWIDIVISTVETQLRLRYLFSRKSHVSRETYVGPVDTYMKCIPCRILIVGSDRHG